MPSHVSIPIRSLPVIFKGSWRHSKNHLTSSPKLPKNDYTEKINNSHPKGPKPQKNVSEAIVAVDRGLTKGWFAKRVVLADVPGYVRMFPRNENRNEGTFACSPGTKTRTRAHSPRPWETDFYTPQVLGGPAAILFILRDTCRDSIAKRFRACFYGVSHNFRAIRCKMGYRTNVPV